MGTGPTVTIQHTEEPEINEFSGRLPVKKGEQLAIDATEVEANYSQGCDHCSYVFAPPLVDGSGARGSLESTDQLLVQATIEPDADGDGFGDETQDQCPSSGDNPRPLRQHPAGRERPRGRQRYGLLLALGGLDREPPAGKKAARP